MEIDENRTHDPKFNTNINTYGTISTVAHHPITDVGNHCFYLLPGIPVHVSGV